ncbi:flavin reductase family protein [Rheinheimera marina]|uniref:Flavin reductase family protein n=1 Tax=Rheinheimera marina TaxID=1774958 RepID=A0ABV9JJJ9_9GAMM
MSSFTPVELKHASRLLNHGAVVLVTSQSGQTRNIMAAAWSMPVEFTPPRVAVVIDKNTFSKQLISESGVFGLCIPGAALAKTTYAVGSCSGRDLAEAGDKFQQFGLTPITGPVLGLPLLEQGCAAWLECRLIPEPHSEQAYDTCFAEVVSAAADPRIFANGRWDFRDDNQDLHSLHHLGAGTFIVSGRTLDY